MKRRYCSMGNFAWIAALFALVIAAIWSTSAARAQEVLLYDQTGFNGPFLRLTQSAPSLTQFNFDNEVSSIRVISGQWSFHRDDNFQNVNGPQMTLGPGDYPNIEQQGFPRNLMSSVRLISFDTGDGDPGAPVNPVQNCRPPYQSVSATGRCVFRCAEGTMPDEASGTCVCNAGFREIGSDRDGRRVCRIDAGNPNIGGHTPDVSPLRPPSSPNLDALPQTEVNPSIELLPRGQVEAYTAPAGEAQRIAEQNGFSFQVDARGDARFHRCNMFRNERGLQLVSVYTAGFEGGVARLPQTCVFRLFGNRSLAPGWVMTASATLFSSDRCAVNHAQTLVGAQQGLSGSGQLLTGAVAGNPYPEQPNLIVQMIANVNFNLCERFTVDLTEIRLRGPASADWRDAFR